MAIDPDFNVREKKVTRRFVYINVHPVNGDLHAIEYLKNTDPKFVEGLFFFAKRYGRATFTFEGVNYLLLRNRNLSYTIRELNEDEDPESVVAARNVG